MPSHQDRFIFVTGVVGRAFGSGKFDAEHVRHLTQTAYDAFNDVFGEPTDHQAKAPPPQSVGTMQSVGQIAQQVVASVGGVVPPETKPFALWGGDKAYLGWKDKQFEGLPETDVCWGVWQQAASEGNTYARDLLEKAAAADPTRGDPKWHDANRRRISRAKAILGMLR